MRSNWSVPCWRVIERWSLEGMALKFLLDQNFPQPVADVSSVDATVEYVALRAFDAALTERGTPDWLIYLRAAESGEFDGIVTRDRSQLDDAEELVVLNDTDLSVVTWQPPVEDPIKEWDQLLASMPLIRRHLEKERPVVVFLPKPALRKDNVTKPHALLGRVASAEGRSLLEMRAEAREFIREELTSRGLDGLGGLLRSG